MDVCTKEFVSEGIDPRDLAIEKGGLGSYSWDQQLEDIHHQAAQVGGTDQSKGEDSILQAL
jgi:hypothetical protein